MKNVLSSRFLPREIVFIRESAWKSGDGGYEGAVMVDGSALNVAYLSYFIIE